MAKKRKTRQEKVIADLRRQLITQTLPQPSAPSTVVSTYSLQQGGSFPLASSQKQETSSVYAYVLSDLRKTLILTSIAIASQIILYFVLRA